MKCDICGKEINDSNYYEYEIKITGCRKFRDVKTALDIPTSMKKVACSECDISKHVFK